MLSLSPAIRIFVHAIPTDMRKHFDGLAGIVTHSFGMDVLRGDYFVFLNRIQSLQDSLLGPGWTRGLGKTARTRSFPTAKSRGRHVAGN